MGWCTCSGPQERAPKLATSITPASTHVEKSFWSWMQVTCLSMWPCVCSCHLVVCSTARHTSSAHLLLGGYDMPMLSMHTLLALVKKHLRYLGADFISREDALEVVLPHLLDLDKEGGPGLGKIALVQTPQIFYNRNVLVSTSTYTRNCTVSHCTSWRVHTCATNALSNAEVISRQHKLC